MTLDQLCGAVHAAGQTILSASGDLGVQEKSSRHDLVTRYDAAVQAQLRESLLALEPEADFFGEEGAHGERPDAVCRFIVDPIDGTANFVKGLRRSCVSVGFERAGEIVLGAVYNPYSDELFSAGLGAGAFLNGRPIRMTDQPMEQAMAFFGTSPYYPDCLDETFRLARQLLERCLDIRRSGSAALDLCELAAGRAEIFYEYRLSPWDYAAGSLIVREAGGLVTSLAGAPLQFREKSSVAAGNPACWPELVRLAAAVKEEPR